MDDAALEVIRAGARTTVQDLGRPGHAAIGVSSSGAGDRGALRLANRLVANAEGAAALEVMVGGLTMRARRTVAVAITGAPRPVTVADAPAAMNARMTLVRDDILRIGTGGVGVYTYLAVSGGFAVPMQLGSAATDVLGGIGPAPIADGDQLALGPSVANHVPVDSAPVASPPDPVVLRVTLGPRPDWCAPDALERLCTTDWTVTEASNRVALRLTGTPIARVRTDELASEGIVRGAIQIPPDGMPIVFGPDHPTTGGYPVLAVVIDDDLDAAAQAQPGARVRFRRT